MSGRKGWSYNHNIVDKSILINRMGFDKKQMDKKFKDVVNEVTRKEINRHEHWLRGFGRFCAVCGVKVICVENEL